MHVKFNSGSRRLFSAGLCFAASGLYLATVARHFIAYQLSTGPDLGSLSRAAEIEPWNAELRWKLGRYALFVAQNPTLAVSNLESAVALNPHLARYWLDLAVEGETVPAEAVWHSLISLGQHFTVSDAFPFFDYLLQKRETETAVQVWEELVKRSAKLQSYAQPGNLIVDGGLERDFLNGGFDWRYSVTGPLQLSVDTSEFHGGNQALRMVFRGPAVSDAGIYVELSLYSYTLYTLPP